MSRISGIQFIWPSVFNCEKQFYKRLCPSVRRFFSNHEFKKIPVNSSLFATIGQWYGLVFQTSKSASETSARANWIDATRNLASNISQKFQEREESFLFLAKCGIRSPRSIGLLWRNDLESLHAIIRLPSGPSTHAWGPASQAWGPATKGPRLAEIPEGAHF